MGDADKVLNVLWGDHDAIVVSYRGGPWKQYLARIARRAVKTRHAKDVQFGIFGSRACALPIAPTLTRMQSLHTSNQLTTASAPSHKVLITGADRHARHRPDSTEAHASVETRYASLP